MHHQAGRRIDDPRGILAAGSGGPGRTGSADPGGRTHSVGVGGEGCASTGRSGYSQEIPVREENLVSEHVESEPPLVRQRSPLYFAQHAPRYQRQELIRDYQQAFGCRLIVMIDSIFDHSVVYFEELLFNASPSEPLHLILWSPGGDGEVAVRLVRSAQARCSELTVLIPDIAKSAATLFALGADRILMGPAADLGPVDPQFQMVPYDLVSAKDIIEAVERALADVADRPDTFPLHAGLLADVNALSVQQARSALDRTDDLVREALLSNPRRSESQADELARRLHEPLIEAPKNHAAIFSAEDAGKHGLPAVACDTSSEQWRRIWQLFTHYYVFFPASVYEGDMASQVQLHR